MSLLFTARVGSATVIQQAAAPFGSQPVCIGVVTGGADDGARLDGGRLARTALHALW